MRNYKVTVLCPADCEDDWLVGCGCHPESRTVHRQYHFLANMTLAVEPVYSVKPMFWIVVAFADERFAGTSHGFEPIQRG